MKQYLSTEQTANLIELGFAPEMRKKGVCPTCGSVNLERTTMGEMLNKTTTVNLVDEDN